MSQSLPGPISRTLTSRRHVINTQGMEYGSDVVSDSGNVDSGSSPTTLLRPGNVLVLRTSTGRYVEANDANGDRSTRAAVVSAETPDADWASDTFTFYLNGALVATVASGAADDTPAEIVTAFNAGFAAANAPLFASTGGTTVTVSVQEGGAHNNLRIESTLVTAYGTAGGAGSFSEASGTDADYRVTDDFADQLDSAGAAGHVPVRNLVRAFFDSSELINLTADAQGVLTRRGARFG
jgi:hypothetical protein